MVLAANSDATPEVRAVALAGVREVQGAVKKDRSLEDRRLEQIDHEIILFLQNPEQNTPKLKPSGVPRRACRFRLAWVCGAGALARRF